MAVNTGLASLSEALVTAATGTYVLAVVGYTGEYSFGRRGRIAHTSVAQATAERELVGVAAGAAAGSSRTADSTRVASPNAAANPFGAGRIETGRTAGDRWGAAAVALTVVALLLHVAAVVIRGVSVDRVPWGNMYEFTLVVGLLAVIAWLATLVKLPQLRYLGLFVMMPVLLVMFLAGTLYTKASKLVPALQSYWLAIHVSAIAISTGILMTSAAITALYLVRARHERTGGTSGLSGIGSRLPAASTLDKAAYRTVAFAFPLYTAGIIFGAIWAEAAWGRYWGWDPKETWAFIAWVIYAMYLHARATAGWKGQRAAYINMVGFGAMIFNFFIVNLVISGLHSYAGLS